MSNSTYEHPQVSTEPEGTGMEVVMFRQVTEDQLWRLGKLLSFLFRPRPQCNETELTESRHVKNNYMLRFASTGNVCMWDENGEQLMSYGEVVNVVPGTENERFTMTKAADWSE